MLQKCLIILLVLILSQNIFAQAKFEIGIEGGITSDKYTIEDPMNRMRSVPCISLGGGINVRYNVHKNFFYEGAFLFRQSSFGFSFKGIGSGTSTEGNEFLSLPLRVGYHLKLSRKFEANPLVGIAPTYIISHASTGGEITYYGSTTYESYFTPRPLDKTFFAVVQMGASFELKLKQRLKLSVNPSYYWGTTKITVYDIIYTALNNQGATNVRARMNDCGSYFNFNCGIKYLLSSKKK